MRVLHVTTTFPRYKYDYWGPFVFNLCEALADGAEVHVLAPETPESAEFDARSTVHRFRYMPGKSRNTLVTPPGIVPNLRSNPLRYGQVPLYVLALRRAVKRLSPDFDVVHAHWVFPSGYLAAGTSRAPVIATAWGAEYFFHPDSFFGRLVKRSHDRVDFVVPVSNHMRRMAVERFGCREEKVRVIPNGVNTDVFTPGESGDFPGKAVFEGRRMLATARRLVPEKRVDDLIRGLAPLLQKRGDVGLLIGGDGPERPRLEALCRELRLERSVEFCGFLDHGQMLQMYRAAWAFVVNTQQEGLSTAVLESMACGTPVVATDAVGNDEPIEHLENGYLYPIGDLDGLAEGVERILDDEALRVAMSEAARARILKTYSYDVIARQYLALYEEAASLERR